MAGKKGHSGGARQGTRPILKRLPNLFDLGIEPDAPHQLDIDGLTLGKCGECGAVWWSDYVVVARTVLPHDQEDSSGAHWPVLFRVEVKGQPEKHRKDCPMK